MQNTKLAIAIPTYERSETLHSNILAMIPQIEEYSIPIFISDNSTSYNTEKVINELKQQYEFIYYFKNRIDLGHDKNSFYVLQLPKTEHVWLLGDSFFFKEGAIKEVLDLLEIYKPEIMSVNAANRDLDQASGLYSDCDNVLNKFGWHLTLTGATIYSLKAISTIGEIKPELFRNFPQLGLMFTYLSRDCSFYWMNKKLIIAAPKKGYWVTKMFSIFIDDWSNAIRSLPSCYPHDSKEKVIVEHSLKSNIFGFKALLKARIFGAYDLRLFIAYKDALSSHSPLNNLLLASISVTPRILLKILLFLKKKLG